MNSTDINAGNITSRTWTVALIIPIHANFPEIMFSLNASTVTAPGDRSRGRSLSLNNSTLPEANRRAHDT